MALLMHLEVSKSIILLFVPFVLSQSWLFQTKFWVFNKVLDADLYLLQWLVTPLIDDTSETCL